MCSRASDRWIVPISFFFLLILAPMLHVWVRVFCVSCFAHCILSFLMQQFFQLHGVIQWPANIFTASAFCSEPFRFSPYSFFRALFLSLALSLSWVLFSSLSRIDFTQSISLLRARLWIVSRIGERCLSMRDLHFSGIWLCTLCTGYGIFVRKARPT